MIVVCNTSPIINLAAVGQLNLLHNLYGQIHIPEAVHHEIAVIGKGEPGSKEVQTFQWIVKTTISNRLQAASLQLELDKGEAEAISLAIETKADLLLLDERRGRTVASRLGLKTIGILGCLIEAKHKGLIPSVKPVLNSLIAKAGFWITKDLYSHVLKAAGE